MEETLGWRNMRLAAEGGEWELLTALNLLRLVSHREFRDAVVAGIADTAA